MPDRRQFLGFSLAAIGGIFVPKYERWYRQGSGLLIPPANDLFELAYSGVWSIDLHGTQPGCMNIVQITGIDRNDNLIKYVQTFSGKQHTLIFPGKKVIDVKVQSLPGRFC